MYKSFDDFAAGVPVTRPRGFRRRAGRLLVGALVLLLAACAPGLRSADAGQGSLGVEKSLTYQGIERTFLVHVPPSYDGARPVPLVMLFHGGFGAGENVAERLGMNQVADRNGFIVVYPDGVDKHWNDGRATTDTGIDDVGFVVALIDWLDKAYNIDGRRVYATGLSNGGYFTLRLACEAAERFTAFAPVMATMPLELSRRCDPGRPVPIMMISGTDDPMVPWQGGKLDSGGLFEGLGGEVISVPETIDFWARRAGCDPAPDSTMLADAAPDDETRVRRLYFDGCRDRIEVILLAVEGGGHTWPGTRERRLMGWKVGATSQDINASEVIWRFFARHARR